MKSHDLARRLLEMDERNVYVERHGKLFAPVVSLASVYKLESDDAVPLGDGAGTNCGRCSYPTPAWSKCARCGFPNEGPNLSLVVVLQ